MFAHSILFSSLSFDALAYVKGAALRQVSLNQTGPGKSEEVVKRAQPGLRNALGLGQFKQQRLLSAPIHLFTSMRSLYRVKFVSVHCAAFPPTKSLHEAMNTSWQDISWSRYTPLLFELSKTVRRRCCCMLITKMKAEIWLL